MRCFNVSQLSHNIDEISLHSCSELFRLSQTASVLNTQNLYIKWVLDEKLQKVIRQVGNSFLSLLILIFMMWAMRQAVIFEFKT